LLRRVLTLGDEKSLQRRVLTLGDEKLLQRRVLTLEFKGKSF